VQPWPKAARLLNRAGFQRVYHSGRRWSSPFFTAFALRNEEQGSRVGLTTPRALGKAVRRNRIRRRVREAVRRNFATLPSGWDLVLNPRGAAMQASFADLEATVQKLFRELGR
jgi:ribonuclease P protein component